MVSPVLHVLPLTHPLSLLSNDCSAAACFQGPLFIAEVLEAHRAPGLFAGNGGQKILRLRRAEQFFSNRLRRAWARDFPGSFSQRLFRLRQAVGGASEQQQQQRR